jgi:hypothetical protein
MDATMLRCATLIRRCGATLLSLALPLQTSLHSRSNPGERLRQKTRF